MMGLITSMPFHSSITLVDQDAQRLSSVTISRITLLSTSASNLSPRQPHDLISAQSRRGLAPHLPDKGGASRRLIHSREEHLSVWQDFKFYFGACRKPQFISDFEWNCHLAF